MLALSLPGCSGPDRSGGGGGAPPPPPDSAPARTPRRLALVIGNAAYPTAPLRNPGNDAQGMRAALQGMQFEVHGGTDLSLRAMNDSLNAFVSLIQERDVVLFYYAGHGVQANGENYLIPVDARINREADVKYASLAAQKVLDVLEGQRPSLAIVIMDACRDNPFVRGSRSFVHGLASMDAPIGALIAYATAPRSVASDGSGRNGLYTQELLRAMQVPGRELDEVFRTVRHAVHHLSSGAQTPWESVATYEDFYFIPAAGVASTPHPGTRTAYRSDTLQVDVPSGLDTVYAAGVGAYRFGASPEEINRLLPTPFATVDWNALPVAGEYKTTEVRYFSVPLWNFAGTAGEGLPYGQLYTQCKVRTDQSNIVFLFTREGLFRVSLRFYPDCASGNAVVRQVAQQYGLSFRRNGEGSFFEWAGERVVFAGVADVSPPNVSALEWVARDGPRFEGQDRWFDPR